MSEQVATDIAGALHRLNELGDSTILNPATESEVLGLRKYLANELPKYANELIANWFIMRNEYEPIIAGFNALTRRAHFALQLEANARARGGSSVPLPPQQQDENSKPTNIIPLNQ